MIRYDKGDIDVRLHKIVSSYNAKRRRVQKANGGFVPDKASVKELKKNITSRREMEKELRKLQTYTKRQAEKTFVMANGMRISNYEYQVAKRAFTNEKAQLTRELKTIKHKYSGRRKMTLPKEYFTKLRSRQRLDVPMDKLSLKEWYKRFQSVEDSSEVRRKNKIFYKSFFSFLTNDMDFIRQHVNMKSVEKIEEALRQLNPDELYAFYDASAPLKYLIDRYKSFKLFWNSEQPKTDRQMQEEFNAEYALGQRINDLAEIIDDLVDAYKRGKIRNKRTYDKETEKLQSKLRKERT